jgi:LmbE family N-acetylglucosaminyl deacetylase
MLVAPHPGDESLSCAVALQRAVHAGAAIRIIYATDGENNPWPQRLLERKWRLDHSDRRRWGQLRRKEALDALALLGVRASDVYFLALPDQGLTDLLLCDCRSTIEILARTVTEWAPTHLLLPSIFDIHPDHNALAVMFRLVWKHLLPRDQPISVLNFVVHGHNPVFFELADELRASPVETATKLAAIARHKTQYRRWELAGSLVLKLARRRFLQYAERPERFLSVAPGDGDLSDDRLCTISRDARGLQVYLRASFKPLASLEPRLLLIGYDRSGRFLSAVMRLPALSSRVTLFHARAHHPLSLVQCHGSPFRGMKITIPPTIFSRNADIFAKVDARIIFFDQAGWCELSGVDHPREMVPSSAAVAERSRDPLPNLAW